MKRGQLLTAFSILLVICIVFVSCATPEAAGFFYEDSLNDISEDSPNDTSMDIDDENSNAGDADVSERSDGMPPPTSEYDEILGNGDGYFIVKKHVETYDTVQDEFGVVDINNNWIHPLSNSGPIAKAEDAYYNGGHNFSDSFDCFHANPEAYELVYTYLGEGMFAINSGIWIVEDDGAAYNTHGYDMLMLGQGHMCYFYNAENDIGFFEPSIGWGGSKIDTCWATTMFHDGFALAMNLGADGPNGRGQSVYKISKTGETERLGQSNSMIMGPVSEEVFITGQFIYDLDGNVIADLGAQGINPVYLHKAGKVYLPYFENGVVHITFNNPAEKLYGVTIDKSGNFLSEPELMEE